MVLTEPFHAESKEITLAVTPRAAAQRDDTSNPSFFLDHRRNAASIALIGV
jgi:hypothetical protein